ncbi:MAG: ribulose-phosphate 3-epimerase [Firmicutes bacterium]|nr:ribulose-phosphate 3-epimerase [Bacillota bacterium]
MKELTICPSLLAADFSRLGEQLQTIKTADMLHIDIMDGHYVPNLSFGPLVVKAAQKACGLPLDVHLMVSKPEQFIPLFAELSPKSMSVHYETVPHLHRILTMIKERGIKAGVVFNPHTPVDGIKYIREDIDYVLIMTVNPGFGGQVFIPEMYQKIRDLKELVQDYDIGIQVDGGVSLENARKLKECGVNIFVAGSAIFNNPDPAKYIQEMRESLV